MTAGSACGAGDFATGLFDALKGADDLVSQLRRGLKIMTAGQRRVVARSAGTARTAARAEGQPW
jgi:hypothetical protein